MERRPASRLDKTIRTTRADWICWSASSLRGAPNVAELSLVAAGKQGFVIGEISSGKVWRLDATAINVSDGRQKLGASYTRAR